MAAPAVHIEKISISQLVESAMFPVTGGQRYILYLKKQLFRLIVTNYQYIKLFSQHRKVLYAKVTT
jgi:hypothetical protein